MNKLVAVFSWCIIIFLIAPIIVIIYMSFSTDYYFNFDNSFSFKWYLELFTDDNWQKALNNTLKFGVFSTIISLLIGVPAALWLTNYKKMQNLIMGFIIIPMIIPPMISAVSWFFFYNQIGLTNSFFKILVSHTILGIPFVVISVMASMANYNQYLEKSAKICGANSIQVFFKITLPIIYPGICVGAILSFISSFDDLIVALFLSNYSTQTLPLLMWSSMRENISPVVLAVTTILVVFSLVSMLAIQYLNQNKYFFNKK